MTLNSDKINKIVGDYKNVNSNNIEFIEKVRNVFKTGITFDNSNIPNLLKFTNHTITDDDGIYMKEGNKIVIAIDNRYDNMITIFNDGIFATIQ